MRNVDATSTVPTSCLPLPLYLKEANDHHIPFGHQCLDTFLILQTCGAGPHSPPQPLSNALSCLGPYVFFWVCAVSILEELECRVPYHSKLLGQLWFRRPIHLGQGDRS